MKLIKRTFEYAMNLFGLMLGFTIASGLYIKKHFKSIKLCRIRTDRIGHLAANTDLFLRRLQLRKIKNNKTLYLGVCGKNVAIEQLLKMFR